MSTGSCSDTASTAITSAPRTFQMSAACSALRSTMQSIAPLSSARRRTRSIFALTSLSWPSNVSRMYEPASGRGYCTLQNSSPSATTLRSMNSTAVGLAFACRMVSTLRIPVPRSANGTSTLTVVSGLGRRRSRHLVMTASVPSEPMSRCLSDSPLASFTCLPPTCSTVPSARTTSSPRT